MVREGQELPYLASLRAFEHHCCYANRSNDFAVPYQTGIISGYHHTQLLGFGEGEGESEVGEGEGEGQMDSKEFPSIVAVRTRPAHPHCASPYWEQEKNAFIRSGLKEMHDTLCTIPWRRVDVRIERGNAHATIIGQGLLHRGLGKDVARHAARYLQEVMGTRGPP
jgi:hypothetical protein